MLENHWPNRFVSRIGGLRFDDGRFSRRPSEICLFAGEQIELRVATRRPAEPSALVWSRSHSSEVPSVSSADKTPGRYGREKPTLLLTRNIINRKFWRMVKGSRTRGYWGVLVGAKGRI